MESNILIVLVNDDVMCAYPIGSISDKEIDTIRQRVRERVKAEVNTPRPRFDSDLVSVRLQVVQPNNPTATGDYSASVINDIMDQLKGL